MKTFQIETLLKENNFKQTTQNSQRVVYRYTKDRFTIQVSYRFQQHQFIYEVVQKNVKILTFNYFLNEEDRYAVESNNLAIQIMIDDKDLIIYRLNHVLLRIKDAQDLARTFSGGLFSSEEDIELQWKHRKREKEAKQAIYFDIMRSLLLHAFLPEFRFRFQTKYLLIRFPFVEFAVFD